jgi:hypothetical protein
MRQVTFSNSVCTGVTRAFGLYCLDGGCIEDIAVSNVICDTNSGFFLNRPIQIDLRKRTGDSKLGSIRNVQVSNFVARTDGRVLMTAADGGVIENVLLRDIRLRYPMIDDPDPRGATAKSGQFCAHSPEARIARAAVVADNMNNLVIDGLAIEWPRPGSDAGWFSGPRAYNGSRELDEIDPAAPAPAFAVLWGRDLRGGIIRAPLARPSDDGADKYALTDSDIRVEE